MYINCLSMSTFPYIYISLYKVSIPRLRSGIPVLGVLLERPRRPVVCWEPGSLQSASGARCDGFSDGMWEGWFHHVSCGPCMVDCIVIDIYKIYIYIYIYIIRMYIYILYLIYIYYTYIYIMHIHMYIQCFMCLVSRLNGHGD